MIFWLLCSFCFATPTPIENSLKKGQKVQVSLTYGADIEGWVARFSSRCIVISNRSGGRTLDVRTIKSIKIGTRLYSSDDLNVILNEQSSSSKELPKQSTIVALGVFNAGLPFGLIHEQKEALGLGIFDVAVAAGGIYTLTQQRATSIPIFLGLAGLRIWSVKEVLSRTRNQSALSKIDDCTLD